MPVGLPHVPALGSMIERILVSCSSQQDLNEWVEHLQKQTKVTSLGTPSVKPHSVPSHTVSLPAPTPCRPPGCCSRGRCFPCVLVPCLVLVYGFTRAGRMNSGCLSPGL